MNEYPLTETKFGFRWGPLSVTRLVSDEAGGVLIEVAAAKERLEIRASPKGQVLGVTRLPVVTNPYESFIAADNGSSPVAAVESKRPRGE